MLSKLYKFSKLVVYLNSCSMDLGRDRYGLSQLGPSFPYVGFFAVPRTFLNIKSPGISGLSFTLAS